MDRWERAYWGQSGSSGIMAEFQGEAKEIRRRARWERKKPKTRVELVTPALRKRCSAIELLRRRRRQATRPIATRNNITAKAAHQAPPGEPADVHLTSCQFFPHPTSTLRGTRSFMALVISSRIMAASVSAASAGVSK